MANALLYYRTEATPQSNPTYADPVDLPAGQKLDFTFPEDIFEGIQETYGNNIKSIPIPNQDGVRVLNIQENGLNQYKFTINGVFEKDYSKIGITRMKAFRKIKQVDTTHLYGVFGLKIDNANEFNIDPIPTKGLYIESTIIGYAGQRTTRYDFSVTLGFGGTA